MKREDRRERRRGKKERGRNCGAGGFYAFITL